MTLQRDIPIDVAYLLPTLDLKLIELLKSLKPEEWQKQTIAKLWTVKDVVAHLADGNIRMLSILRDHYFGEQTNANSYQDLVGYLNVLNADWIKAMRRVSPQMLILLLETTSQPYCDYFKSLNPFDKSVFTVGWVGEKESQNWMEIARQYTEKWLHQQQIRAAVNKPGLMTPELYYPFIDIFMLALPYTYREISADNGSIVKVTIPTDIGGAWYLLRTDDTWELKKDLTDTPTAEIIIDPDISWRLFSKGLSAEQVNKQVTIHGDEKLGSTVLTMLSVMA